MYIFGVKIKVIRSINMGFLLIIMFGFTCFSWGQIGVHGDVFIASNGALAVRTPEMRYYDGIVQTTETNPGKISYLEDAHGFGAHNGSHSEAPVLSNAHRSFVFPVGDQGVYQPMMISQGDAGDLNATFHLRAFPNTQPSLEVEQISNRFYWEVSGNKEAKLSLSWNNFSEIAFLTDDLAALVMLGFNGSNWEIIPATVAPFAFDGISPSNLSEGVMRSTEVVDFNRFEAVTLGRILLDTSLKVSEGVTPNGDGINDRWYIENIERYPDAQIRVYNRWGVEVFHQAGNYRNNWDATYKNNTKKLPSAPYYYQIDQDNNGSIDVKGWIYITY